MIPEPGKALAELAAKLALGVLPEVGSTYGMANAGLISLLMGALAEDFERAIANRFADVAELRDLFAQASAAPGATERAEFAASEPASLALADVCAWHDEGMALLIELHPWAEQTDTAVDSEIWQFLYHHTERNRFAE